MLHSTITIKYKLHTQLGDYYDINNVFFLIYIIFKNTLFKVILSKLITSLKSENKYDEYKEKKINEYFNITFVLFLILYIISKVTNSILYIKYFDIIPLIYLFCKLVFLYK